MYVLILLQRDEKKKRERMEKDLLEKTARFEDSQRKLVRGLVSYAFLFNMQQYAGYLSKEVKY